MRFVVWLIASVLFAQWLGFQHAIAHAQLASYGPALDYTQQVTVAKAIGLEHHHLSKPCAVYDAATLGATLPATPLQLTPLLSRAVNLISPTPPTWQAVCTALFRSRAPPLLG